MGLNAHDLGMLERAMRLAERGRRTAAPNPIVGCLIERGGRVLAEGFHLRRGGPHAEAAALAAAEEDPRGATAYVTLEPCSRHTRTPPCTDALLGVGIRRVVVALEDPTQQGIERLRAGGVEVDVLDPEHPLARRARRQNAAWRTWALAGRPHVRYKAAATLDGRTATRTGDSRWISSPESRRLVHEWRAAAGAVMVGIGTALADDPDLRARGVDPPADRQPLRVVLDRQARLPPESRLALTAEESPVVAFVDRHADARRRQALERRGVETAGAESAADALRQLARRDVSGVLLEGGPTLAASLLDEGLIDLVTLFLAPMLLGDSLAPGVMGGRRRPIERMADALRMSSVESVPSGPDILVDGWLRDPP